MRKFQLVIDLETEDESLTEQTIMVRWNKVKEIIPGVYTKNAAVVPILEPNQGEGLERSIADVPGVSARLVRACRNAGVYTVGELADALPEFYKFRNVGEGSLKDALAICISHGADVNPDIFEASPRAFAIQLLAQRKAGALHDQSKSQ